MTRRSPVGALSLLLFLFRLSVCDAAPAVAQQPGNAGAPETFSARAQAENKAGICRVGADCDSRRAFHAGLRSHHGPRGVESRWLSRISHRAQESPGCGLCGTGRSEKRLFGGRGRFHPTPAARSSSSPKRPVAFLCLGQADAKPRAGYEVAVIQLKVDGRGDGRRHDGGCRARQAGRRDRRADR